MKLFLTISVLFICISASSQVQYKMLEGKQKGQFRLDFTKEPPIQGPVDSVWESHIGISDYGNPSFRYYDSSGNFLFWHPRRGIA